MVIQESDFYLGFSNAPNIGPKRLRQLIQFFKTTEKAWSASQKDFVAAGFTTAFYDKFAAFREEFSIEQYRQRLSEKSVTFLPQVDPLFPRKLFDLEDVPIGLYIKGNADLLDRQGIAIVGSRKMTSYGHDVTEKISSELADAGFVIVSGLALGVDAVAHRGALDVHGETIAVLGCGADCCYPQENSAIYRNILRSNGAVISEYPLGMQPTKGSFPARNRIIAAISDAVLVTEAGVDSGSLITAEIAQTLEKKVFAVPGPITSKVSLGTAQLLKNGAVLASSTEDILSHLGVAASQAWTKSVQDQVDDPLLKKILALLSNEPLALDSLAKASHIPIHQLNSMVSELEMLGLVSASSSGVFSVRS